MEVDNAHETSSLITRVKNEVKEQLKTSIPVTVGSIFYRIPWIISIHMVGNIAPGTDIGSNQLAAAALAQTLANVTGMSIGVGLSTALTTLAGQAHGASTGTTQIKSSSSEEGMWLCEPEARENSVGASSKFSSTTAYLVRGLFIQAVFVFPIGLYWIHGVKPLLLHLGQDETLSSMTEEYLRILVPGLWAYSINWTITCWLQAIGLADIPTFFALIVAVLHAPFNFLFINGLGWGYKGAAFATTTSQIVGPSLMIYYLLCTKSGRERLPPSTHSTIPIKDMAKEAIFQLSDIYQYLSLAFPGIVIISEWWASEVVVFLSGTLTPESSYALDGMTIYQAINSSCFMIPVGCSVAASTRVGNLLGANDPNGAKLASITSIGAAIVLSTFIGGILWFTPHTYFPSLLDPDKQVISETARTIPYLSFYVIADGVQITLNGIIKGCGRQPIVMPIVIAAYWLVGVPLAYYFAFVKNGGTTVCESSKGEFSMCGIAGLTAGMTIGTYVHFVLLAIAVAGTVWANEAEKAQRRLNTGSKREKYVYTPITDTEALNPQEERNNSGSDQPPSPYQVRYISTSNLIDG